MSWDPRRISITGMFIHCFVFSLPPLPLSHHLLLTWQNEEKTAAPASKKPGKGRPTLGCEKNADSSFTSSSASAEKQRQEARKRLLAAKKAASFRQNSATESSDSIEIYVPEAQTRLWETLRARRKNGQISVEKQTDAERVNTQMLCGAEKHLNYGFRVLAHKHRLVLIRTLNEKLIFIFIFCGPKQTLKQEIPHLRLPVKTSADELDGYFFLI